MFEDLPTGIPAEPSAELRSVEETATAFTRRVERLQSQVSERRDALRQQRQRDIDRAGVVSSDGDRRTIDKDRRRAEQDFIERGIEADTSEYRRNLVGASQQERDAMLQSLNEKLGRLEAIAETYPSPSSLLAKHGLGSSEHTNLIAALSGAGKAELTARAREAVLSGNRILASAVLTVNDRLDRRDRAFPSADFAARVIGDEHRALMAQIDEARRRVRAAADLNKAFERGGESSTAKIERGVRTRQAAGAS